MGDAPTAEPWRKRARSCNPALSCKEKSCWESCAFLGFETPAPCRAGAFAVVLVSMPAFKGALDFWGLLSAGRPV